MVVRGESVKNAAMKYDIPKSTLHDRAVGKVALGAQSDPERYLTDEEEERLVKSFSIFGSNRIHEVKEAGDSNCFSYSRSQAGSKSQ